MHPAIPTDRRRLDKFVGFSATIGCVHRARCVRGGVARAVDDGSICLFDPIPTLVAVHREIAADNRRDPEVVEPDEIALKVFEIRQGSLGRRVAPVEESVNRDRHPGFGNDPGEGSDLVLVRMHAAGRQQPHQMCGAPGPLQPGDKLAQFRHPRQLARGNRRIDARQILHDEATRPEIGVSDLGISHLAVGEPDIMLACLQMCVRPARRQPVPDRHVCGRDGIVRRSAALAPAVENAQDQRARTGAGMHCGQPRSIGTLSIRETARVPIAFPKRIRRFYAAPPPRDLRFGPLRCFYSAARTVAIGAAAASSSRRYGKNTAPSVTTAPQIARTSKSAVNPPCACVTATSGIAAAATPNDSR